MTQGAVGQVSFKAPAKHEAGLSRLADDLGGQRGITGRQEGCFAQRTKLNMPTQFF